MDHRLWGGRFAAPTADDMRAYNDSFRFDRRLAEVDIQGSIAWAGALEAAGLITAEECETLVQGLALVAREFADDAFEEQLGDEDIHTAVERRLHELVGTVALKLHTGRSRNDQVATDMRLFAIAAARLIDERLLGLQLALLDQAEEHAATLMPGYTHLQRAQPVRLAHHLLAWCEMLDRDRGRLDDAARRMNECPLGSGALATTTFAIDREMTARALGFDRPSRNSLDATGDRDFLIETVAALATTAVHLSRIGEELVLWSSQEFGFCRMSDAFTTGSSMMPQKKNPDVAELARAKTGRIYGDLLALLTVMKGLPLTYNKDMQEDKEPLFDAVDTLLLTLPAFEKTLATAQFQRERMRAALRGDFSTATDLADLLVRRGMAFRDAHHVVGRIVRHCIEQGIALEELGSETLASFAPEFGTDAGEYATLLASVEARRARGGTAPEAVREQLLHAEKLLERMPAS